MITKILAHRGFSASAPENTMAAFDLGIKAGADGFELDVHMTKDGELVVVHDETINRTTDGTGWIKDLTLSEIKALDAGSWFSPHYEGERIPTLQEVLELAKETNDIVNIELKNDFIAYPGMEESILRAVEDFGLQERAILSSFNHVSIYHLHKLSANMRLGILYDKPTLAPWAYAKSLGATAIHPHHLLVTEELVARSRDYGINVRPYTVDEKNEAERLLQLGVDAIITNVPDRLLKLREVL